MRKLREGISPVWSQRIKSLLTEKGMSQKELSQKSGVPESFISDWVGGRRQREPGIMGLNAIAEALEVPLDYLMGVERLDELETNIMKVSGYGLSTLLQLFMAGWTLQPPAQITIEESMRQMEIEAHESM